jgi:hypothetical protein
MKRKFGLLALVLCIAALSASIGAFAATKYALSFNGKKTALDVQVVKGDAYVSAKKLGELLGYKVVVDSKKSTVTITTPTSVPVLKAGEYQAKDFIISDVQAKSSTIGWSVTAEVKSLKAVKGAIISLSFFGSDGKRVGKATGSISNTDKGNSTTVTFVTTDDLTGWTTLRPQVDMSY